MKNTFAALSILSLAFVMTIAASAQPKSEQLTRQQLDTLVATAKTPAEHQRIASFYEAKAATYRTEAEQHESMIAAYKANPGLSTSKNQASTINHCEYVVKTLNSRAAKSDELAQLHEKMAESAKQK